MKIHLACGCCRTDATCDFTQSSGLLFGTVAEGNVSWTIPGNPVWPAQASADNGVAPGHPLARSTWPTIADHGGVETLDPLTLTWYLPAAAAHFKADPLTSVRIVLRAAPIRTDSASGPFDVWRINSYRVLIDGNDRTGWITSNLPFSLIDGFLETVIEFSPSFPAIEAPNGSQISVELRSTFERPGSDDGHFVCLIQRPQSVAATANLPVTSDFYKPSRHEFEVDFGETGLSPDGSQVYRFSPDSNDYVWTQGGSCGFEALASGFGYHNEWKYYVNATGPQSTAARRHAFTIQRTDHSGIVKAFYPADDGVNPLNDWGFWNDGETRTFTQIANSPGGHIFDDGYPITITIKRVRK